MVVIYVKHNFPEYFSYILSVNFIGEGDRRTPPPTTKKKKKKKDQVQVADKTRYSFLLQMDNQE